MQERKTPETNQTVADSDATSDETLADIEKEEHVTDSKSAAGDKALSPDGAFDESGETKDAGPM